MNDIYVYRWNDAKRTQFLSRFNRDIMRILTEVNKLPALAAIGRWRVKKMKK